MDIRQVIVSWGDQHDGCRAFRRLVAAPTDFDLRGIGWREKRHTFDVSAKTTAGSLLVFENAMELTLRGIADHGLRAVIVLQTPIPFNSWGEALDALECRFRRSESDRAMALAVHRQFANRLDETLVRLAAGSPNVRER